MKTVISVSNDIQISMDDYTVVWTSKTFDDNTTIGEIKDWIIATQKLKKDRNALGLSGHRISDLNE